MERVKDSTLFPSMPGGIVRLKFSEGEKNLHDEKKEGTLSRLKPPQGLHEAVGCDKYLFIPVLQE